MADKPQDDEQITSDATDAGETGSEDQDTEGHFLLPDTGAARVLASSRSRDIDRDVRVQVQRKESRPNDKRGR